MEVKKDFVVQPVVKRSGSMAFLLVTILPLEHRWHMHPGTGKQPIRFYQYQNWAIDGNGGRVTNSLFTGKPLMYLAAPGLSNPYVEQ